MTGESIIIKKAKEIDEKIKEQFEKVYHNLENQKDKPLAVFDNCIHGGGTIIPVLSYLNKNGYKDLRVLIGDAYHDHSPVKIHESYGDNTQMVSCGIFGTDFGVDKSDNDITSYYDSEADRERVILCRKEMRRIIQDGGK